MSACTCVQWDAKDTSPRQCTEHYTLWRGAKRLVSVSKIVGMWPQEACSNCHWPMYSDHQPGCIVKVKVDNAQRRGKEVDGLFSAWVIGKLAKIPSGVGQDSKALFLKLTQWFDKQNFSSVESQVLVADDEVGGVLDLRLDGMIVDLKCTYDVSESYPIQVGGYLSLSGAPGNGRGEKGAILHCTERFAEPKLIPLNPVQCIEDFEVCREMFNMVARRSGKTPRQAPKPSPALDRCPICSQTLEACKRLGCAKDMRTATTPTSFNADNLCMEMSAAKTMDHLLAIAAKCNEASEDEKARLRGVFAERKRYLTASKESAPLAVAQNAAVSASADAGKVTHEGEARMPAQAAAAEVWI